MLIAALLLFAASVSWAQTGRFRVMTYNVENLFDTCRDEGFDDLEFQPASERRWNSRRYWAKQGRLARVIAAAGGEEAVSLVGLCEVENDSVVHDLCRRTMLRRLGYDYVMTKSRDRRGLDVALLYQPLRFKPLETNRFAIPYDENYGRHTRDILHVAGRLPVGDTLDVFVCHLPSRRGGTRSARTFRRFVAETLRQKADSLLRCREKPAAVLMGDFNDGAGDASLSDGFGVKLPPAEGYKADERQYYVLSEGLTAHDGIRGTYKYKGQWNRLDQIIVSGGLLLPQTGIRIVSGSCRIFSPPFLVQPDATNGGVKPFRTYLGPLYTGGFSDHLPLVVDFDLVF